MAAPMDNSDEVEKKLYQLHYDILRVQNECNKRNLSCFQINKAARHFFIQPEKKENYLKKVGILLSTLVGLLAVVVYVEPVYRWTSYMHRQMLLKTIPVLDWRKISGVPCFIGNSFKLDDVHQLGLEECQNCSSIISVGMMSDPDVEELMNNYLDKDIPVTISNTVTDKTALSIEDIIQLYLDNDVMRLYTSCEFSSSVDVRKHDHRILLKQIRDGKITQYYALWGNCFTEAAKLFRQVYERPDYLPPSMELTTSSGIYICNNYTDDNPIEVPFLDQVTILIQLSGRQVIRLKPREPCHEQCQSLEEVTLSVGSSLIVTDFFYDLEFDTCGDNSSITVNLGAKWDT